MTKVEMQEMPTREWMRLSKRPQIHEWLSGSQSSLDKARLSILGNIVVPQMAYFAANMLAEMWLG